MKKAIEEINTPKTKNSHLEDLALKTAAQYFGEELLPYLNIEGKFKAIAPTEVIRLDVSQMLQDFNYVMQDGSWSHFEFQSTNCGIKDLRRFREYEAVTSRQYQVAVTTYVIFSGKIKNPVSSITEGINTYHIHPITLQSSDADGIIADLRKKQEKGIELGRADLLPMLLTPLMSGKSTPKERIMESLKILNAMDGKKETREDLKKIQSVLYAFAVKLLDKMELKEIEEVISMTILGEMLVERGIKKGISDGIALGINQGISQGISQGICKGKANSILELLDEYQPIPAQINNMIMYETNPDLLSKWLKIAAKSTSLKDFIQHM